MKHKPKNVVGLLFKEEQVGYLAGVLAGLSVKKSGPPIVGSVGGFKEPPVDRFIAGYQGARYAQPKVKTLNAYSSDWDDQAKCKEIALSQIARGATVVFQVAGGCGLGALSAAKQRKVWGIGVDADQSFLGPFVLTSALKRVDEAVFQTIQTVVDDSWKGGATSPSASTRTESGSARSAQKCRRRTWTLSTRSRSASAPARSRSRRRLAPAGDGGDHPDLMHTGERRLETVGQASILAVEVDVDKPAELAALVQQEIGDREGAERLSERRAFDFELPLTAGLLGDERRESDYDHSPTSTDRIGGS